MGKRKEPEQPMTEEQKARAEMLRLEKTLNERQRRFVEELETGISATEAAQRAGYSAATAASQASRMLRNDKVLAYRRARVTALYLTRGVSGEWIGLQLLEIYSRCMAGEPHMSWESAAHTYVPDGTWVFDAKNAVNALEKLGRSIGMFVEKKEKDGDTTFTFVIHGGGEDCAK